MIILKLILVIALLIGGFFAYKKFTEQQMKNVAEINQNNLNNISAGIRYNYLTLSPQQKEVVISNLSNQEKVIFQYFINNNEPVLSTDMLFLQKTFNLIDNEQRKVNFEKFMKVVSVMNMFNSNLQNNNQNNKGNRKKFNNSYDNSYNSNNFGNGMFGSFGSFNNFDNRTEQNSYQNQNNDFMQQQMHNNGMNDVPF